MKQTVFIIHTRKGNSSGWLMKDRGDKSVMLAMNELKAWRFKKDCPVDLDHMKRIIAFLTSEGFEDTTVETLDLRNNRLIVKHVTE